MRLFGSKRSDSQPNQVLHSQLDQCLKNQTDVGIYKWLPDFVLLRPAGAIFHQPALKRAMKVRRPLVPCELLREPTNKRDPRAIAVLVDHLVIGYVPAKELEWWHRLFAHVGGENTRLVGDCTFMKWTTPEGEALILADCQIRVIDLQAISRVQGQGNRKIS